MDRSSDFDMALKEVQTGIELTKCQQCGCMTETLTGMAQAVAILPKEISSEFRIALPDWLETMKPIRYACLGCEHCYAGAAQNAFTAAFPETENQFGLNCEIQTSTAGWPPVVGEYIVLDPSAPVAVVTLASPDFPKQLADQNIPGLAIVGKLETENIGIDKIIRNTISNSNLRYLILAGVEAQGHFCGQTLLALSENGIDQNGRVIGSRGKRPILRNVTCEEIAAFRSQIQVIDLIGCECIDCVRDKIAELREQIIVTVPLSTGCGCADGSCHTTHPSNEEIPTIFMKPADQPVKLDKAGYFVILPLPERKIIHVEHYSYDNVLLHEIEGTSARSLYLQIIAQNWVSEMGHAAYLGKELAKSELSLQYGIPYNQDAA